MAAKLTTLTNKIAIELHLVAESCVALKMHGAIPPPPRMSSCRCAY